ncbi:uncharacterized protein (TIGR03086 family) [Herbihabitans rhizosphaerae]|uniref:Uncharacterized protein (TIGR03086 family) n=1 Tax=Herbihabitans rhizosphaerae TaxID=1872711 RepID=A0A4Q7KBZ7_9PSEU|nr:uncharacterized protein (TIGR03086 family) [Herbihabitans rhizosphaerae]
MPAWREPAAWEGESEAGGVRLPAEMLAGVALQELTVHGWDLARATGQPFTPDALTVEVLHSAVAPFVTGEDVPGLFKAPVPVADDAPLLDRTIALTGRDPNWTPST